MSKDEQGPVTPFRRWACCGPDFDAWVHGDEVEASNLRRLFEKHGEIRVRYAALLMEGLKLDDLPVAERMACLKTAVKEKWQAPCTLREHARFWKDGSTELPIPWLDRYLDRPTQAMAGLITSVSNLTLCVAGKIPLAALKTEFAQLTQGTTALEQPVDLSLLEGKYVPQPDFRGDSVQCWLSYLRCGGSDPLLGKAHAKYRPDQHHPTY